MDLKTIQNLQIEIEELLDRLGLDSLEPLIEMDVEGEIRIDLVERAEEAEGTQGGLENLGMVIGQKGETLAAIEYIIALMVNRDREEWYQVVLDADGYRRRREQELRALALETAERVRSLNEPVALRPMPNYERKVIHTVLGEVEGVLTESIGEGRKRKVVVKPK